MDYLWRSGTLPWESRGMGRVSLPQGFLVAIEGIDGAGKTTQATRLAQSLTALGYDVLRTREPTDGPWGRRLRATAITGRLSPEDEFDTFVRDREEHVRDVILPALAAHHVVLVDRYYFSSMAYQGARGIPVDTIRARNESFAPIPDLLVHLDVPAAVGIARVVARGGANLFEREDALHHSGEIFRAIVRPYLLRLDGTLPEDDLAREILAGVRTRLPRLAS